MLIKQLFQGKNYRETLRRRMWVFVGMDAVGAALIVLALTLLRAEDQDHFQSFYMGAGCGLALCGAVFLVRTFRLLRDPAAAQKARVSEQDEREQAIVRASMCTVFWVFYVVLWMSGDLSLARSAAYLVLVLSQMVHIFECRGRGLSLAGNPYLVFAALASVLITFATVYLPILQPIFSTTPVGAAYLPPMLIGIFAGPLFFGLLRILRRAVRRRVNS